MELLSLKTCAICKLEKPHGDFHKSQSSCKACRSAVCRRYYRKNKETVKRKTAEYFNKNKHRRNEWEKRKSASDPLFKMRKRLRHRIRSALYRLKFNNTRNFDIRDLGCTIKELKAYLESKFQPNMTWDNWGNKGWHIDHIKPLSLAKDEQELSQLCHYTNLQPLWAKDNIIKSNKVQ